MKARNMTHSKKARNVDNLNEGSITNADNVNEVIIMSH